MLLCQEMSHSLPTTADTTEVRQHQMYQGIAIVSAETRSAIRALIGCATGMLFAMSGPYHFRAFKTAERRSVLIGVYALNSLRNVNMLGPAAFFPGRYYTCHPTYAVAGLQPAPVQQPAEALRTRPAPCDAWDQHLR